MDFAKANDTAAKAPIVRFAAEVVKIEMEESVKIWFLRHRPLRRLVLICFLMRLKKAARKEYPRKN